MDLKTFKIQLYFCISAKPKKLERMLFKKRLIYVERKHKVPRN